MNVIFSKKDQQEYIRIVGGRYIAKSYPYKIMVSTPNAPGGLMQTIEHVRRFMS